MAEFLQKERESSVPFYGPLTDLASLQDVNQNSTNKGKNDRDKSRRCIKMWNLKLAKIIFISESLWKEHSHFDIVYTGAKYFEKEILSFDKNERIITGKKSFIIINF